MNTSEVYLVIDIFDPEPGTPVVKSEPFYGYRFKVSGSSDLDKGKSEEEIKCVFDDN